MPTQDWDLNRDQFRGFFLNWRKHICHCPALTPSTEDLSKPFTESTLTLLLALRWEMQSQRQKWTATVSWWRESGLTPSAHCLHHQCRTSTPWVGAKPKQLSTPALCSVPAHVSLSPQGSVLLCYGCNASSTAGRASAPHCTWLRREKPNSCTRTESKSFRKN